MQSSALIHQCVLPGRLRAFERPLPERFPVGIQGFDQQVGGIPQSAITQILVNQTCNREQESYNGKSKIFRSKTEAVVAAGKRTVSSGRSALLFSLLAQSTGNGHFCALVDASDCFDPASAEAAGVDLARVLWVRCGVRRQLKPLEQAFKAADILLHNGGFGIIAVDLGHIDERHIRRVPLTTWFRFARVVEKKPLALVFLTNCPVGCARLTLAMKPAVPRWNRTGHVDAQPCGLSLGEMEFEIEIEQSRLGKPVQSARPKFTAASLWA
jgi:hypothetical protein